MLIPRQRISVKSIRKSAFLSQVLTLAGGTGIAQVIPILFAPILTRLFTTGEYGILSVYVSVSAIIAVISTGRYELAILLPKSRRDAYHITILAGSLTLLIGILVWIIAIPLYPALIYFFDQPANTEWIFVVPLSVISLGLYATFSYRLNRDKEYRRIAGSKIAKYGITGTIQTLGGLAGYGAWGLIIGKVLGEASAVGILIQKWKSIIKPLKRRISFPNLRRVARIHTNFPKFNAPHALLTSVSANLPVIILTAYFGASTAGLYGLSLRICYAPVFLIANSVRQVFSRRVSELFKSGGDVKTFTRKTILSLIGVGIIPFTLLVLFGPRLFAFIFGEAWRPAGIFSQYLTIWYFLSFIGSPIMYIPMILGQQKKALFIELASFILRTGGLFIGVLADSEMISILAYSIGGGLVLLYMIRWAIGLTREAQRSLYPSVS